MKQSIASKIATAPGRTRCAVYTRKSVTKGLDQQYNSLQAQEDKCRQYISLHDHEGWVYAETYSDAGISGGTTNRPQLQRMLADATAGRINLIVVYKLDRLSRTQLDLLDMLDKLSGWGVEVASVSEQFDTSTPAGRAMRNLLGVFAQMEREMVSERTKAKFDATRRQGYVPGGKPPIGYVRDKLDLVQDRYAPTVREIFRLYAQGLGGSRIAETLNEQGARRPLRSGLEGYWRAENVNLILRNPVYAGYVPTPEGELLEGRHEPIVPREEWHAVQRRMDAVAEEVAKRVKPRKWGHGPRRRDFIMPLEGILRCGSCGCPLTPAVSGKGHRYYQCMHRRGRSKPERCECPNLNADEIERFAMRQLADPRADSHLITSILSRLPDETSETVVAAVKNIDKLTDYCDPELMKELYSHVFEEIVFDWRGEKIDIKFKKD